MKTYPSSLLSVLVLLAIALTALPVAAQSGSPVLSTWDTQVWPEYDRPSVLVITSGTLASGTTFPQQVRVPIPANATIHAVAYPEPSGNLLSLAWTSEPGDNSQIVVFELDQPNFVVEYYADILAPPPGRSFALNLVAPYAAQQASLALRQPSRSSDLQTTPAMVAGGMDTLGNPTYTLELKAQDAGQSTPLQVSYSKADAQPSVSSAPPASAVVDDTSSESTWWPWVAGVAAAVLAGGLTFYLVQRRRASAASRQTRRRDERKLGAPPARPPSGGAAPGVSSTKFCVQCGQKFEGSDKFCRKCGAPRR